MIKPFDKKCTGCNACLVKCPENAIHRERAELGFYYPVIDESICIHCGLCEKVCPINKEIPHNDEQNAFAATHLDRKILNESTSGGVFSAVASWILEHGGVVYGCAYNDTLKPIQIRVDSEESLYKLRGSKYVQSDTNNSFYKVENDLKDGRDVLYSGTPCQIDGLRCYLEKEYERLVCIDIICHGVPSAEYFIDYISYLEKAVDGTIDRYSFRDKRNNGWNLSGTYAGTYAGTGKRFTKRLNYFDNYFYSYFLSGEIYRQSCYTCKYAQFSRVGDFTLGDLWGAEGMEIPFDVRNGCSLVLLNTDRARRIWNELSLQWKEISIVQAVQYNAQLQHPSEYKESRVQRVNEYVEHNGTWIQKNFERENFMRNIISRIKYAIPKPMKSLLLKLRYSKK